MKNNKLLPILTLVIAVLQTLLFFVSWLVNVAFPNTGVRSLLGSDGIRWFMGSFAENISGTPLGWLVLISIAYGALRGSGLCGNICHTCSTSSEKNASNASCCDSIETYKRPFSSNRRMAFRLIAAELIFAVIAIILLVFVPHAVLLNVKGSIFPSSFSDSIVPLATFVVTLCSVTYGVVCGTMRSLKDIYDSFVEGVCSFACFFPFYVFAVEFCYSLAFVLETI